MLRINSLSYSFDGKVVFDNLNLVIDTGFVSLYGNNSSGKTTLIKIISCLIPTIDKVMIDDVWLNRKNLSEYLVRLGVVLELDENSFLFNNVYDELSFPLKNLGYKKKEIRIRVDAILNEFEMSNYKNALISEMDIVSKKMLLIMISLIHSPKVLILDNTFMGFDRDDFQRVFSILKKRCNEGLIILSMTSDLKYVLGSDRLLILNDGIIAMDGKPVDILKNDLALVKMGIEMPFMIDLSIKLQFYKLIDDFYLDMEGLVDKLWG